MRVSKGSTTSTRRSLGTAGLESDLSDLVRDHGVDYGTLAVETTRTSIKINRRRQVGRTPLSVTKAMTMMLRNSLLLGLTIFGVVEVRLSQSARYPLRLYDL